MPGVDLADVIGIRRRIWAQGGADVAHEGDGRARRGPDAQHPDPDAVRAGEGMPLRLCEMIGSHRDNGMIVGIDLYLAMR